MSSLLKNSFPASDGTEKESANLTAVWPCALTVHGHVQMRSCARELWFLICTCMVFPHIKISKAKDIYHTTHRIWSRSYYMISAGIDMMTATTAWPAIKQNTASAELSARARPNHADQGTSTASTRKRGIIVICTLLITCRGLLPAAFSILRTYHHSANLHVDICMRLSRPSVLLGERLLCILRVILCAILSSCAVSRGLRGHKSFIRRNNVQFPPPCSPEILCQRQHTLVPCHSNSYQARTQLLTFRASHSNHKEPQL